MTTHFAEEPEATDAGYAVALRVQGRLCVVVGGGPVGERKARELHQHRARVRIVAPTVTDTLQTFIHQNSLEHCAVTFTSDELQGAFLVVAATDNERVNREVLESAHHQGILSNAAGAVGGDVSGDFETMATVRRGLLQIAVTTSGASPTLATRIKNQIAEMWGPEWADWVGLLARLRVEAKCRMPDARCRAEFLRRLAARDDLRERLASGDASVLDQAEQMLNEAVRTQIEGQAACPAR